MLDNAYEQYELLEKNVVYFEFLALGQAVIGSLDLLAFMSSAI